MRDDVNLVVGDNYAEFARQDGVLTLSSALERVREPAADLHLVMGLGVTASQVTELFDRAPSGVTIARTSEPAPMQLTHKHEQQNVLISQPVRVSPNKYQAELLLDDSLDRLSDHVTGLHLGGMLLVEAVRQFGTAVLECEYGTPEGRLGLLLSTLNVCFTSFAFPLPTKLTLTLEEDRTGTRGGQVAVRLEVVVAQASVSVAEAEIKASIMADRALFHAIEGKRARTALQKTRALYSAALCAEEATSASAE